jgi:hypothetical protein
VIPCENNEKRIAQRSKSEVIILTVTRRTVSSSDCNMFEGYCDRSHLKTLCISVIISLFLITLIYHRQNPYSFNQSSHGFRHLNTLKKSYSKSLFQPKSISKTLFNVLPSLEKTPHGVLSSIELVNSPFIDLECHSSNIIPILVLSKASNIEIRDAIRRTWGFDRFYRNDTIHVKIFFLVGVDDFTIKRIQSEQDIFPDVIQVSIPDMYSFSAYKELSAMIWVRTYLPKASFYIKTDDDIIVNMKSVIDILLPTIEDVRNENLVIGWFGSNHSIQRGAYQKFVDAVIPPSTIDLYYAMNLFYVITRKAIDRMLNTLHDLDIIEHPGDTFVTGALREAADVQIKNLASSFEQYKYVISTGPCREPFRNNSKLLFCTSSLHADLMRAIPEYFDTWNGILSQH